ncbi:hypothetical protein V1358_15550 [Pseudoalteromonas sp. YIC-656]|uniref:hypothetical protein n=1 Tax=Pseudoalteromonas pernae TaxID=3118054 RepID=UPI003242E9CD
MPKYPKSTVQVNAQQAKLTVKQLRSSVLKKISDRRPFTKQDLKCIKELIEESENFKLKVIYQIKKNKVYKQHGLNFCEFCKEMFNISRSESYKYVNRAITEACLFRSDELIGQIKNNDFLDHCHAIRVTFGEDNLRKVFLDYRSKNSGFHVDLLASYLESNHPNTFNFLCSKSKKLAAFSKATDVLTEQHKQKLSRQAARSQKCQEELSRLDLIRQPDRPEEGPIEFETFDSDSFPDAPSVDELKKQVKPKSLWLNHLIEQRSRNASGTKEALDYLLKEYDYSLLENTLQYLDEVRESINERLLAYNKRA